MTTAAPTFDDYVASRGAALLRLAYMLTGDRHLAEDLTQDVLIGGGATELCMISAAPPVDVVEFGRAQFPVLSPAPSLRPTTVGGQSAQSGTVRLPDGRT